MRLVSLAGAVLLLFNLSSDARDLTDSGFPFITQYSPYEYEAHVQNWGVAFDSTGRVFIANLAGPMSYNGIDWESWSIPNQITLSIHQGPDDRIWVGGNNEIGYLKRDSQGADYLSTKVYTSVTSLIDQEISFGEVWDIADDGSRVFFISNNYVLIYEDENFEVHRSEVRFSGHADVDGKILVREAGTGLLYFENGESRIWDKGEVFKDAPLMSHFNDGERSIFCSYNRCFQYDGETMSGFETEADHLFQSGVLQEAILLQDGTYLFATRRSGLIHLNPDGSLIRIINEEHGLTSASILGITEDKRGSVWAATINGINRVDFGLPLRRFDSRNGISGRINGIKEIGGTITLASSSGVHTLGDSGNFSFTETPSECRNFFHTGDSVYLLCNLGLYLYENEELIRVNTDFVPYSATIIPGTGKVALISQERLDIGYLDGTDYTSSVSFSDAGMRPHSFAADENLNIWAVANSGELLQISLTSGENGKIEGYNVSTHFSGSEEAEETGQVSITLINDTPHFLTSGFGINRYDHETGQMVRVSELFGDFFDDDYRVFFRAHQDFNGNIWFRSDEELQGALRQQDGTYSLYTGALSRIRDSYISEIYACSNNYVWILTDQGVVRFTPEHSYDHTGDFHTQLRGIIVRGDTLSAGRFGNKHPEFDFTDNEIRFTFESFDYFSGDQLQFRVKLKGFDADWSGWTSEYWKDYTNISEGTYNFQVEARNIYGVQSAAIPFSFTIFPPWYRTWWAYILYGLLAGSVVYTGYRIRLNQVLREQRIRNRIAGDLHDEISATLSSISYFAQAIKGKSDDARDSRFIQLIADSAGEAKEKITDIVWAINPEHDDWISFLAKCRRYASDLLDSKNISYTTDIDNDIPGTLNMQFRQHLWMIYKEMLTNAARHSDATHVEIKLKMEKGRLKLIVSDNGKGISKDDDFGNGLSNIRKRASEINAEISLESKPGFGTRWHIKVRP